MLTARLQLGTDFEQRPLLVLFLIPTILSSYVGGLGPGLVSTVITAGCVDYYLIPPLHHFRIQSPSDTVPWIALILNGVLVSVLSGALRRGRTPEEPLTDSPIASGAGIPPKVTATSLDFSLNRVERSMAALLMPVIACALQWAFWGHFRPFIWFLFYPAVFLSAWIGGLAGALPAAALASVMAVFCFLPPVLSFSKSDLSYLPSVVVFMSMGALFGQLHDRLARAKRETATSLETARHAHERIQAVHHELEGLYAKAREMDELKTQFFSNVSHELRTPLTLVLAPLARHLAGPILDSDLRADLELMDRNARVLLSHVNDLLDMAKLDAGRMGLHPSEVDLAELVRLEASRFASLAMERGTAFEVEAPGPLMAQVDAEKIRRILANLFGNAFKFTPPDGRISVTLSEEGDAACLEVRDSGPGVPEALREAVFDRFRQADGGAARSMGGTGLGLAIVKEFVQLHQGSVTLDGGPEGGARFRISLPLRAPAGVQVLPASEEASESLVPVLLEAPRVSMAVRREPISEDASRVLVVEDNPDMNAFLVSSLGRHYRVEAAFSGQEGLDRARTVMPDLILTDVMMPGLTGDQLLETLRRDSTFDDVPIILLTAKADDGLRLKMLRAGATDFLCKPFAVDELLARVDSLLAGRRRNQAALKSQGELLARMSRLAKVGGWSFEVATGQGEWTEEVARIHDLDPSGFASAAQGMSYFHGEHRAAIERAVQEAIEFGRPYDLELELVSAAGVEKWVRTQAQPILVDGKVVRLQGAIQDITKRKRAEEEIQRLNANLERTVEERTAELRAANSELEAFAYAVSHDLRAPLRAMSGFSRALVEDFGVDLPAEARTYLDQIMFGSQRMGELIDGLLMLSRSTRGDLQRQTVDLSALAEEARLELEQGDPGRRVVWRIEQGLRAQGDPRMLQAALRNLFGNAWKYSTHREQAEITFEAVDEEGMRQFMVSDNGVGFDMAHASKLFQPFQRLHRQDEFPGLGIGLATVQRIIHRHGGRIIGRSEPGRGAEFLFSLPKSPLGEST